MECIKKLPIHEAQKIAAGEVVDRPANVVKELIENAIDAQTDKISIFIEDGGKKLIRVVDNGCGMSGADAHHCFEHHATSKIATIDDLDSISTFGFRGEALSSIASISHISMKTQENGAQSGIHLELEQAVIKKEQTIAHTPGTDIAVHNLFYNVPARKKFLKTRETEWRHIINLFYAFCLASRSIHFTLYNDGKQVHNCPPVKTTIERIAQLWDHHLGEQMIECEQRASDDFRLQATISNHMYSRFDRSMIFLFVNNRWIKNIHLARSLLRGYSNVLQPGQYPASFVFISIKPTLVDINIHPRKEEVKFLHPRIIETTLQEIVKKTLHTALEKQLQQTERKPHQTKPISFDFKKPVFFTHNEKPEIYNKNNQVKQEQPATKEMIIPNITRPNPQESHNIIGQLNKTYILLEQDDGLFIIDQHAAHERILYEQFSCRFEEIATTKLLFPPIIKLTNDDIETITPYLDYFKEKGIEIEPFGSNQLIIHATPVHIKHIAFDDIIKETIGWIIEYRQLEKDVLRKTLNEKIHAKMACAAAVKAGDTLSMHQMQQLISDLKKTKNNLTCPHGRPTGWLLTSNELKKKFKRDYRAQKIQ